MTARRTLLLTAAVLTLTVGCQGQLPSIDGPSGGGASAVDLPSCPAFDAPRTYDPPAEEQPDADPGLTTADLIEDLDVGDRGDVDQGDAGSPGGGVDGRSQPEDPAPSGTTRDGAETTDPDVAERPAEPAPTDPMSAAQRWAEAEAPEHFAGMWLDNDQGAVVIAFTEDLDRYTAEVRERFGAGWWVVRGERSVAELRDLADAVGEVMPTDVEVGQPGSIVGWGPREDRGVVAIDVVGGDDEALAELAAQLDDPAYCFAVADPPAEPDVDGPVRTLATVSGWRDGVEPAQGALLEIAHDEETARRLIEENVPADLDAGPAGEPWQDGRHGDLDDVDLATHVVAVYSAGRSGSCPEWVAEVSSHGEGVAVGTEVPSRGACTDDFNPYRTVLAIERDRLPSAEELPTALDRGYDAVPEAVVTYP